MWFSGKKTVGGSIYEFVFFGREHRKGNRRDDEENTLAPKIFASNRNFS